MVLNPITSFEKRMRLAFGLTFSILFSTVAVSLFVISRLTSSLDWVSHTYQVVAAINATHVQFTSARVNGKNYLITRQPKYLAIRELAISEYNNNLSQVLSLTSDNSRQQKNVEDTDVLSDNLFRMTTEMASRIEVENIDEKQAIEFTEKVEIEAAKVISKFQIMRDEEGRLLLERQSIANKFAYQAYSIMPVIIIIQILLTGYIYYCVIEKCKYNNC